MHLTWNMMFSNIIASLLTVGTITGVVSAFWKYFTERRIKGVEAGFQKEIANLNSRLDKQKESFIHVFKAKFDLEIKVYQEIWAAMFELRSAALSMQPRVDSVPMNESENEKRERLWKRFVNFRQHYNETLVLYVKYQPFYPKEIHDRINDFMGACNREGTRFELSIPMTHFSPRDDKAVEDLERNYETTCDLIRKRLETISVIEDKGE